MKKSLLILAITIFIQNTYATNNCFIVKEGNKLVIQEGTCDMRHAPCSTFKIAISLGSSVFPGVVMRIPYTLSDQETIF